MNLKKIIKKIFKTNNTTFYYYVERFFITNNLEKEDEEMLQITKSTSLVGESKIDGGVVIALNADITAENIGNTFVRQSILNQEKYNANRRECRKDISDFQDKVFEIEDQFIKEALEFEKSNPVKEKEVISKKEEHQTVDHSKEEAIEK